MADHQVLVRAILDGDRRQFRVLVEEFQRLVSHVVFRMIPDSLDREDICQEVFIKVYQNLASFRHDSKLSTWVAQIAYNTCLTFISRKQLPLHDSQTDDQNELPFEGAADDSFRPDRKYETSDMSLTIAQEIDRLPVLPGTVLTLFHLEQMSIEEICEIMKLPEGTVKSHLFRARKLLKSRLARHYRWEES